MSRSHVYLLLAVVSILLTAIAPQMMRIRLRVLRALHLNTLADWHERHRNGMIIAARITFIAAGLFLFALAFGWI